MDAERIVELSIPGRKESQVTFPERITAYCDGWLAHAGGRAEVECPYHPDLQDRSANDWLKGHRDRANTAPGVYLTDVLDVGMMDGR